MKQDPLDGLSVFIAVAEAGGFSAAAVRLGLSPSAVSQAVRSLEARLGLTLFQRTTRSVALTEIGQQYLDKVRPALAELVAASDTLGKEATHPGGWLRLSLPRAGFHIAVQPLLRRFMDRYPDIKLELRIENALIDIVEQGCDAGIRFGHLVEKDMVAVRIGPPLEAFMAASPDYLRRRGVPQHPRDLLAHDCVTFRHVTSGTVERWALSKQGEDLDLAVSGRVVVNDSDALVQAALEGLGIVYMVSGHIERLVAEGRLVRVLQDWSPALPGLTLYYPDRRRASAKLRALIEFLQAEGARASAG